jgi:DDE superfamily endonuclease
LILNNHSAHISKETKAWLADRPAGCFEFTFTPEHGPWLNLVEGFFSKLARSVLRHIRVTSKQELKDRIMAAVDHFNQDPVVHTWSYKLDQAARYDSNFENDVLVDDRLLEWGDCDVPLPVPTPSGMFYKPCLMYLMEGQPIWQSAENALSAIIMRISWAASGRIT